MDVFVLFQGDRFLGVYHTYEAANFGIRLHRYTVSVPPPESDFTIVKERIRTTSDWPDHMKK